MKGVPFFHLYGKNSVSERLKANPKSIRKIFLEDSFSEPHIEKLINSTNISVRRVSQRELHKIKNAEILQGIIAVVDEFEYIDLEDLTNRPKDEQISLILLDRIFDPQNLGSIIRTAACFGKFAVVLPKHKACQVTETVLRVASGGENYTPVSMVSNLTNAILEAKKSGYWIVGAVIGEGENLSEVTLPYPLCLVLGTEGKGIRYGLQKHLDLKAHIPMKGASLSFNVATAAAVFCYEIAKQRNK